MSESLDCRGRGLRNIIVAAGDSESTEGLMQGGRGSVIVKVSPRAAGGQTGRPEAARTE